MVGTKSSLMGYSIIKIKCNAGFSMVKIWHVVVLILSIFIVLFWTEVGRPASALPPMQDLKTLQVQRVDESPSYELDLYHHQIFIAKHSLLYSFGIFNPGDITNVSGCTALQNLINLYKKEVDLFIEDGIVGVGVQWRILVRGVKGGEDSQYLLISFGYSFLFKQGHILLIPVAVDDTILDTPFLSGYSAPENAVVPACLALVQRLGGKKRTSL